MKTLAIGALARALQLPIWVVRSRVDRLGLWEPRRYTSQHRRFSEARIPELRKALIAEGLLSRRGV